MKVLVEDAVPSSNFTETPAWTLSILHHFIALFPKNIQAAIRKLNGGEIFF